MSDRMKRNRSGRDMAEPFHPESRAISRHAEPNRGQKGPEPKAQGKDKMSQAIKVTSKRIGLTDMISEKYKRS